MKQLGAKLEAKTINYGNNQITKWCLSNTAIEVDKNLNIQPTKGNNQRRRIDGMACLLNSFVILDAKYNEYETLI